MKPSNIRVFWWLSVAIVIYWVFRTGWDIEFSTDLATLAKLPAQLREDIRGVEIVTSIASTLFWGALTLGLAWLVVFRHANWARWVFAALFVFRESIMFLVSVIYYHNLDFFRSSLAHENWANPRGYIVPALTIAAIGFVFSGDARGWFGPNPATAQDQTPIPTSSP